MASSAAWDWGARIGANALEEGRARKNFLSDQDHAIKRDEYLKNTDSLKTQLNSYVDDKGQVKPEYKDQYDKAMQALSQNQYQLHQLYDPIKAPGRLQQDWHYLRERVHGIKQPDNPAAARVTQAPQDGSSSTTMPGMQGDPTSIPATGNTPEVLLGGAPAPITSPELPAYKQASVSPAATPVKPVSWRDAELRKRQALAMQKAQEEAKLLAAGAGLSPEQQAMSDFRTKEAVHQAQIDSALKTAQILGFTDTQMDELKHQLGSQGLGISSKNSVAFKPLTGAAGQPISLDGEKTYVQFGSAPDGTIISRQMPKDYKPNRKTIRGTLVHTKDKGWIQTWVYADNPSQIAGYQKTTPSRGISGSMSTSSTVDPLTGLKTTSSRSTTPNDSGAVDFDTSGIQELPSSYSGEGLFENPEKKESGSTDNTYTDTSLPQSPTNKTVSSQGAINPKTPSQLRSQRPVPPTNPSSLPITPQANKNPYINSLVDAVLSGNTPPSQLNGKVKDVVMAIAQQRDPNFSPAKSDSDYKYASDKSTRDLLNYLTSLTGRNGKGGNLGELVRQSDQIDRTEFPAINDKIAWGKLNTGSREIAQYYTTITEVADQVAKILQGGGSGGGTSDAKLRQASELFDKGFTKDQIRGVADSLKSLLGNRKDSIIGDNYYLNRWYKPKPEHFVYAKGPDGKIKRKQSDDQSPLPAGWTMMPQGWTPNGTAAKQ